MAYPNTQPRTDALRQQDRKRKHKQKRRLTGRPGRATSQTIAKRNALYYTLKNQGLNLFDDIPTPGELSGYQKRILEILLKDTENILTNIQIAALAGCDRKAVGRFRESGMMYSILANADIFDRILQRLESKSLQAMEHNIELGDNQSIKMVMQMRGRLQEARQNILVIADKDVAASVTESLRALLPDKRADNAIDADYVVEPDTDRGEGEEKNGTE